MGYGIHFRKLSVIENLYPFFYIVISFLKFFTLPPPLGAIKGGGSKNFFGPPRFITVYALASMFYKNLSHSGIIFRRRDELQSPHPNPRSALDEKF